MKTSFAFGLVASFALVGCGGADTPEIEAPEAPPPPEIAETSAPDPEPASTPDYGPPGLTFAQDGETISGKVGEEFSFLMEVPDGSSTAVNWVIADGAYEPIATYDKTWRALEGSTRYSEIVLMGAEAGETTVTFQMVDMGQPVEGVPTRTLTFKVSD